ncbi:manganese efflux pump MntP family protein [Ruminococcaceae bacterium OttesenSCG-928-I18]|nr:manganese efflux pump MntP family protein [Ruminococcaceae bacterium OttesenSCG-928-I18]
MQGITLVVLALGLAMDAFAVSVSNSMCFKNLSRRWAYTAALCFGLFQGIMPTIGFFAGRLLGRWIGAIDHWLALVLLGFIGGKMLFEGIRALRRPESCPASPVYGLRMMLVQALATSIDALAVGISFAALSVNILWAACLIAAITFACCAIGSELGRRFGALLGDWAQIFGGLLLVTIGLKIWIEHMFLGG